MAHGRPRAWYQGDAFRLLVILLCLYLIGAFLGRSRAATPLVNLGTAIAVLGCVRRVTRSAVVFRAVAIGLGVLLVAGWIVQERSGAGPDWWNIGAGLVFLLFVQGVLLRAVFARDRVDADKIFASACAYLLLGLCWSFAYRLVQAADPQALTLSERDLTDPGPALLHFSFTALTTVGYGAIAPVSRAARALADVEALVGQLYVAVVIARLVSLQITQSEDDGCPGAGT